MNFISKKRKYYAVFLVNQEGSYSYVGKKRFREFNTEIHYKKGTYKISKQIPTYIKGMKLFYFVDIEKGQMHFGKQKKGFDPIALDLFIRRKIIYQLASRLSGSAMKINFMWLIMGLVMGIFGVLGVLYFM